MRLTYTRNLGEQRGWTIEAWEGGLQVTGGAHPDAYGPVNVTHDELELLIIDMRAVSASAQGKPPCACIA